MRERKKIGITERKWESLKKIRFKEGKNKEKEMNKTEVEREKIRAD
jgi:hypothetical protein